MKPQNTAFLRGITHVSTCKTDKVMENEKFDAYPDPYPKHLSARLTNCNSKSTTLPALRIKLSITLIRAVVSELQIQKICI